MNSQEFLRYIKSLPELKRKVNRLFDFSYFPQIETERLLLRRMTHDDAAAFFEMMTNPAVLAHAEFDPPLDSIADARNLLDTVNDWFTKKTGWRWGLVLKTNQTLIGRAGFMGYSAYDRRAEIGCICHADYWGQGYATEVVRRMVQFGFEEMNLHRIEAECNAGNIASARVLEKAGFTLEGIWRDRIVERGKFINLKQFSILEDEYKK